MTSGSRRPYGMDDFCIIKIVVSLSFSMMTKCYCPNKFDINLEVYRVLKNIISIPYQSSKIFLQVLKSLKI